MTWDWTLWSRDRPVLHAGMADLRKSSVPKDPWGNDYIYRFPGQHGAFDLYSYGADGQVGGEGEDADIVSWE